MAEYTKLTWETLKRLLAAYDLGEVLSYTPLTGGQANSSLKITTRKGVFTLSVCDEKNLQEILCLTQVLLYLDSQEFPTTRLVPTRSGRPFIDHGGKPVYIKGFIEGELFPQFSSSMVFQVGRAMARLHAMAPPPGLPRQFPYGLMAFDEVLKAPISHPFKKWLKEKKTFLEKRIDPAMATGFIHGDIFWDNLLFSGNTLAAILDFEEACVYYTLFDLGMAAVGCCAENGQFNMDLVKGLLAGYQQAAPLADRDKKQFKLFMVYAAVAASFWRFRQYNLRYPSPDKSGEPGDPGKPDKKESYKELSSLADQVHAMDETSFLSLFHE